MSKDIDLTLEEKQRIQDEGEWLEQRRVKTMSSTHACKI